MVAIHQDNWNSPVLPKDISQRKMYTVPRKKNSLRTVTLSVTIDIAYLLLRLPDTEDGFVVHLACLVQLSNPGKTQILRMMWLLYVNECHFVWR